MSYVLVRDAVIMYLSMFGIESWVSMLCFVCNSATLWILQETTLFLQMLYNPQFKQRYSEELMTHYQTMIESVVDRNIRDFEPLVNRFKALDSSLERGILTSIEIAKVACKE